MAQDEQFRELSRTKEEIRKFVGFPMSPGQIIEGMALIGRLEATARALAGRFDTLIAGHLVDRGEGRPADREALGATWETLARAGELYRYLADFPRGAFSSPVVRRLRMVAARLLGESVDQMRTILVVRPDLDFAIPPGLSERVCTVRNSFRAYLRSVRALSWAAFGRPRKMAVIDRTGKGGGAVAGTR
jgi:hypothetical protein